MLDTPPTLNFISVIYPFKYAFVVWNPILAPACVKLILPWAEWLLPEANVSCTPFTNKESVPLTRFAATWYHLFKPRFVEPLAR